MKEKFEKLISKRISLELNDDFALMDIWKEEVLLISGNMEATMEATIDYILNNCSDEHLYWMSEVFEDIVKATQSIEFIDAIKKRQQSMTDKEYADDVKKEIE